MAPTSFSRASRRRARAGEYNSSYARWRKRLPEWQVHALGRAIASWQSKGASAYDQRGLVEYCKRLGISRDYFKRVLARKIRSLSSTRKLRMLDWGCGQQVFLGEISKMVRGKVLLEGLTLRKPRTSVVGVRTHIMAMERFVEPRRYDVIVSVGTFTYAPTIARALVLENMCNSLTVGGALFSDAFIPSDRILDSLIRQGIQLRTTAAGFHIMTRRKSSRIDLSDFYLTRPEDWE